MNQIPLQQALRERRQGTCVLIDVREPKEFRDARIDTSVNVPSSSPVEDFFPYRNVSVVLVCHSGGRANRVGERLLANAFRDVRVLDTHISEMDRSELLLATTGWTVDRQFRFLLGVLLLVSVLGMGFVSQLFLVIPVILGAGLTVTALIDRCYLRMAIAGLPWNTSKPA